MGDLFDEFMRELERRRAEAEGREAQPGPDGGDPSEPAGDDDHAEPGDDDARPDASDRGGSPGEGHDPAGAPEPTPIRRRAGGPRSRRAPPPPRNPRPVGGPTDGEPPAWRVALRRLGLAAVVIVVAFVVFLASVGIDLWTDAIWYRSVGFDSVFWTRLGAQVGLFVGALAISLVVLFLNLWLAGRLAPPPDPERPGRIPDAMRRMAEAQRQAEVTARMSGPGRPWGPGIRIQGGDGGALFEDGEVPDMVPVAVVGIAVVAALVAIGIAGSVSGAWSTLLLWIHRVPFSPDGSVTDPIFGRDISFFLFDLPFYRFAQSLISGLLLACLALAGARYLAQATRGGEVFVTRVRVHLAVIAGLYLLTIAFGYQLDKYELVHSTSGAVPGVGYTDFNARFLAYDVLTLLSGVAGALLVAGAFTQWVWPLGAIVIVWFSASIILGRLYPEAIQRLTVDPNEYAQEQRFIANNIAMTRLAYGLDRWDTKSYSGTAPLTSQAIVDEADTFTNARLWDYRPLQTTLSQLQVVRQYYTFPDVDTDRYLIDGTLRQVMLSGRELAIDRNPEAKSWVNQKVIYTHGIGLAMVPVNEVTQEGQPELWVRDLPPVSSNGAPQITQPRIYFGESDDHYVVTGARQAEFDIPGVSGQQDTTTTWSGTTGIKLDSTLTRLLFGLRFRDLDLLISDQITSSSQLLYHRTLSDRLGQIAPFLRYDKDPYLVVDNGRLVYVQDAYTISDAFPHATAFDSRQLDPASGLYGEDLNYLRNSVKITMDAYDGTMHFYVADPSDPIIRAWEGVFPGLFHPLSELPPELAPHLRTPEELFNVQTRMFGRYHVTDPLTLFNNTDSWTLPDAQTNEQSLPSEAYYVVMRMPGEPKAEFLLLQPMIPTSRPNMIAWVAARNDGDARGQVVSFRFPSDTTIFGPAQIEARIDQDPVISAQVTLWNQSGSRVIRGNLIVVPVGDSLLYLQPVYLQSTSSAFPEFQKIIVASPTTIVWGDTLRDALNALMLQGGGGGPSPSPTPGPSPSPGASPTPAPSATPGASGSPGPGDQLPGDVDGLVTYANLHFERAQAALRAGDFATYGAEIAKVESALQRLGELTGSPSAAPAP